MGNENKREWIKWETIEANETTEMMYEQSRRNLKKLRETIGLNQAEFAEVLGISRAALSYYENGTRTPDIKFLIKVGVLTDCNFDYLLGDSPTMKRKQKYDVARALNLQEQEAEALQKLCENHRHVFRTLLSSGKLLDIALRMNLSAPNIINGCEDYDRVVWENMKDVEQLFRMMLAAAINNARECLRDDCEDDKTGENERETHDDEQPPEYDPLAEFRAKQWEE